VDGDEDIPRLFREHDDIGPDSSLWLHYVRQLLKEGKPVGKAVVLTVSPTEQQQLPFGILAHTKKSRLIFWPVLPPGANMFFGVQRVKDLHHITLEFPSERIHVTAYDANGHAVHVRQAWRTHRFPDCDIALWFTLLVRIRILRQQHRIVQRRVETPVSDKKRREDEFVLSVHNLVFHKISLPDCNAQHDYIYCSLCLAPAFITPADLPPSILPADSSLDSVVEGWPNGSVHQIAISQLRIDERTLCVAVACPPGKLLSDVDVAIGLPRSGASKRPRGG